MPPKPRTARRAPTAARAARSPRTGRPGPVQPRPARHARATPQPRAARANNAAVASVTTTAPAPPPAAGPVTAREAAGRGLGLAAKVTERGGGYSGKRMLTAELLAGIGIVALRAVADYEPQANGTLKGKIGHPQGQYGPLPILAGLIVTFFVLSFLAASGGTKAKLAVIAGAIIDITLLMKSADEFTKVADTFGKLGHARRPAGSWQTSGTAAGEPIDGGSSASSGGSGSSDSPGARVGEPQDPNLLVPKNVLPQ
jgi:hypothetical protein